MLIFIYFFKKTVCLASAACSRASPLGETQSAPRWRRTSALVLTGGTTESSPSSSTSPTPLEVIVDVVRVVVAATVIVVVVSVVTVVIFIAVIIRRVGVTPARSPASASGGWWHVRWTVIIVFIIPGRGLKDFDINIASGATFIIGSVKGSKVNRRSTYMCVLAACL